MKAESYPIIIEAKLATFFHQSVLDDNVRRRKLTTCTGIDSPVVDSFWRRPVFNQGHEPHADYFEGEEWKTLGKEDVLLSPLKVLKIHELVDVSKEGKDRSGHEGAY
jgi:hypothetical protein